MKLFLKLIKIVYKVSPSYFLVVILGSIITSCTVFGNVLIPKYLIDELTNQRRINYLAFYGGLIVVWNFTFLFLNKTYNRILEVKQAYMNQKLEEVLSKKIMNIDYQYLEDPHYLDLKERAVFANSNQASFYNALFGLANIISSLITLIGLTLIMVSLGFVLISIVVIGITLVVLISIIFRKKTFKMHQQIIPINRIFGYYVSIVHDRKLAKDIRLYNMNPIVCKNIKDFNLKINDIFSNFYRKDKTLLDGFEQLIITLQTGLIYLYASIRYFTNKFGPKISLGEYSMYTATSLSFFKTASSLFIQISEINKNLSYLKPFFEFLDLKEEVYIKNKELASSFETLELIDVCFSYPKSNKSILRNISFKINKGEKISIVGLNGAGKSTLIKLICRFYKPDSGVILYNGVDIYNLDYSSYISRIACVFQDCKVFAFSIKENIKASLDYNENKLEKTLASVGLSEKMKSLKNGIDTKLNKEYDKDGTDLSGGEKQKITIARALYKDSDIIILDEPTSNLDPLAEADLYNNFNNLVLDKTGIYISHRMSSSVFCDKILVIDNGVVTNFDSHKNLLKEKDSLYYKLFTTQAKNYQV